MIPTGSAECGVPSLPTAHQRYVIPEDSDLTTGRTGIGTRPFARRPNDARPWRESGARAELTAAIEKTGRICQVGFQRVLGSDPFAALDALVESARLGELTGITESECLAAELALRAASPKRRSCNCSLHRGDRGRPEQGQRDELHRQPRAGMCGIQTTDECEPGLGSICGQVC